MLLDGPFRLSAAADFVRMSDRPGPLLLADIVAELERRIEENGAIIETLRVNSPAYLELVGTHRALVNIRQWLLEQA